VTIVTFQNPRLLSSSQNLAAFIERRAYNCRVSEAGSDSTGRNDFRVLKHRHFLTSLSAMSGYAYFGQPLPMFKSHENWPSVL
jgi:hypothetical protein